MSEDARERAYDARRKTRKNASSTRPRPETCANALDHPVLGRLLRHHAQTRQCSGKFCRKSILTFRYSRISAAILLRQYCIAPLTGVGPSSNGRASPWNGPVTPAKSRLAATLRQPAPTPGERHVLTSLSRFARQRPAVTATVLASLSGSVRRLSATLRLVSGEAAANCCAAEQDGRQWWPVPRLGLRAPGHDGAPHSDRRALEFSLRSHVTPASAPYLPDSAWDSFSPSQARPHHRRRRRRRPRELAVDGRQSTPGCSSAFRSRRTPTARA